ncbi:hypothetical protein PAPHI01_2435 [Pancytospora philotis]|nr:hypothetical protein PAPHI01_2435 [Pancytospora philotis]
MKAARELVQSWLLVPKAMYFFLAMFFYELHQFRGTFMSAQFGITKREMGVYFGVIQIVAFLVNLWISALNDRSGKQRVILTALLVGSAALFQTFFMVSSARAFWLAFGTYYSLISATLPLMDKLMLDYLAGCPGAGPSSYGVQRVFSSIGYLAVNFTIEQICDTTSERKNFSGLAFYNVAAALVIIALVLLSVKNLPPRTSSLNYAGAVARLLVNADFMYLMFVVLLCGIVRAAMTLYLGMYCTYVLQFSADAPASSLGWPLAGLVRFFYSHKHSTTTLFGVALEIIIFFNSARIINRLGLFMPLLLAQIAQFVRFVCYYNLHYTNPNSFLYCCCFELLKGMTFGLIQSSAAILVSKLVPPALKTTGQVIYNGTFIALGTVLSGFLFQFVFSADPEMPREAAYREFCTVFYICAAVSLAIILVFLLKYALMENVIFNRANAEAKLRALDTPETAAAPGAVVELIDSAKHAARVIK